MGGRGDLRGILSKSVTKSTNCPREKIRRRLMRLLFFVFIVLLSAQMGIADVPKTMSYQGILTDSSDKPLNGNYDLTFRLYSVQNGGSWLWVKPTIQQM